MKKIRSFAFLAAAIIPVFLWAACSCSTEAVLQQTLGASAQAPVFYGCSPEDGGTISFRFSVPVTVLSAYFDPEVELVSQTEGETVSFCLDSSLPGGSKITADVLVEDSQGNTLNVLVPFRTLNNEVPKFVINEIRSKVSSVDKNKPRTEFVELYVQSAGNLGALRLFAARNNSGKGLEAPIFEFPPVMVKSGEYVVIHTRTLESQSGYIDETGSNLSASDAYEATAGRDFWIPGSAVRLQKTDVIFIMDQKGTIIDGVVLYSEKDEAWEKVAEAAKLLEKQGVWNDATLAGAVRTEEATPTKTINRAPQNNTGSAGDWYIPKKTSSASPGAQNTSE